jgi:hypothetical protein
MTLSGPFPKGDPTRPFFCLEVDRTSAQRAAQQEALPTRRSGIILLGSETFDGMMCGSNNYGHFWLIHLSRHCEHSEAIFAGDCIVIAGRYGHPASRGTCTSMYIVLAMTN